VVDVRVQSSRWYNRCTRKNISGLTNRQPTHPAQLTGGTLHGPLDEGRAGGRQGGLLRAVLARGHAHPQHGGAGVAHDGAHVGKVNVDEARDRDDVADALWGGVEWGGVGAVES